MQPNTEHGPGHRHEQSDVGVQSLAMFAVGLVSLMALAVLAMWGMYRGLSAYTKAIDVPMSPLRAELPADPPEPRLQVAPIRDLQAVRVDERQQLSSYGWVEPAAGVVHIPIERAMQLTLQRGLPARSQSGAGAASEKSKR